MLQVMKEDCTQGLIKIARDGGRLRYAKTKSPLSARVGQPPPGLQTLPGLPARSNLSVFSAFSPITYSTNDTLCYKDSNTGIMMTIEQPGAPHWTEKYAGQSVYNTPPKRHHSARTNIQARKNNPNTRPPPQLGDQPFLESHM
jgi:hypothetical protein